MPTLNPPLDWRTSDSGSCAGPCSITASATSSFGFSCEIPVSIATRHTWSSGFVHSIGRSHTVMNVPYALAEPSCGLNSHGPVVQPRSALPETSA